MSSRRLASWAAAAALLALAGWAAAAKGWLPVALRSEQAATASNNPWGADHFTDVVLTDQHGRKHRLYSDLLQGKAVAVNTFFTVCADVCPLGTAKMRELQRMLGSRMGRDIHFYSISVDPLRDTPEAMLAYAQRYEIGPGWLFLTGSDADVAVVTRKLGLGRLAQTDARESHSTTLTVGHEPSGRWMKNAATDNPQYLAAHMATFLGWPADPQLLASESRPLRIGTGEFLFRNGCAACHGVGDGPGIGPDLLQVSERRPRAWLERFILQPDVLLDGGDPVAQDLLRQYRGVRMPNLGLQPGEVQAILEYIDARSQRVLADRAPAQRQSAHGQPQHRSPW